MLPLKDQDLHFSAKKKLIIGQGASRLTSSLTQKAAGGSRCKPQKTDWLAEKAGEIMSLASQAAAKYIDSDNKTTRLLKHSQEGYTHIPTMASRSLCRAFLRPVRRCVPSAQLKASFSSSISQAQEASNTQQAKQEKYTHFGYENVKEEEKEIKGN
jgi:hypothetical protein